MINGIKTECLRESGGLAICYPRKLVRSYCDETSKHLAEVARDIAYILERNMASNTTRQTQVYVFGKRTKYGLSSVSM